MGALQYKFKVETNDIIEFEELYKLIDERIAYDLSEIWDRRGKSIFTEPYNERKNGITSKYVAYFDEGTIETEMSLQKYFNEPKICYININIDDKWGKDLKDCFIISLVMFLICLFGYSYNLTKDRFLENFLLFLIIGLYFTSSGVIRYINLNKRKRNNHEYIKSKMEDIKIIKSITLS